MRRVVIPVLMMIGLLFCGCGEGEKLEKGLEQARVNWAEAESVTITADVTAELTESSFSCNLLCTRSGEETMVEVLSPENIAGIKARLSEDAAEIEYDGLILAVGDAGKGEISPLRALPMLLDALLTGHVRSIWAETEETGQLAAAEIFISETEYARIWFDRENFAPLHAELVSDGRAVVKCEIKSFTEE